MKTLFTIRGKVKKDNQRGKTIGFPTANIPLHQEIPEGVYISQVTFEGKVYESATMIGNAKTFDDTGKKAENHILDFHQDIYGKWITVKLLKYLRANQKFNSIDDLINQISQDVLRTREFFNQL